MRQPQIRRSPHPVTLPRYPDLPIPPTLCLILLSLPPSPFQVKFVISSNTYHHCLSNSHLGPRLIQESSVNQEASLDLVTPISNLISALCYTKKINISCFPTKETNFFRCSSLSTPFHLCLTSPISIFPYIYSHSYILSVKHSHPLLFTYVYIRINLHQRRSTSVDRASITMPPSRKLAPRIPDSQWDLHKNTIRGLYVEEEKTLDETIKCMRNHGFVAT